jgi:hypothetical protein
MSSTTNMVSGVTDRVELPELPAKDYLRFTYQPLNLGEIRLLEIRPGGPYERIRFSVEHTRLFNAKLRQYTTLSYTWGKSSPTHLLIDHYTDQRLPVTSNCTKAIRRLRHHEKTVLLWIDAISVNQEDLNERQIQVSKMSEIYRLAHHVVAYIGEETDTDYSAEAMTYLASMSSSR